MGKLASFMAATVALLLAATAASPAAAAHQQAATSAADWAAGSMAGSSDWPQFGRTPSFQSFKNVSNPSSPPHPEWTWDTDGEGPVDRLVASPAVFGSTVYLGSDSGHFYALDQTTGKLKWTFAQHCMPARSLLCGGNGIRSSPAVFGDGSVVFGSYDRHVYKVSVGGKLLWSTKTGASIYSPATIDVDGTVLIGTMRGDNCLYALNGQTGGLKWKSCGAASGEMSRSAPFACKCCLSHTCT